MDIPLIITGVMALFRPLLEKGSEKAVETVGERIANKVMEKNFWQKVRAVFNSDEQKNEITTIENKSVASEKDIELIEERLTEKLTTSPQLVAEFRSALNLNSTNSVVAEELLISIKDGQKKLKSLFQDLRDDPGIALTGQYKITKRRILEQLEENEADFLNLIKKKPF